MPKRSKGLKPSPSPSVPPSLGAVMKAYDALMRQWSALLTMMSSVLPDGWRVSLEPSFLPKLLVSPAPLLFQPIIDDTVTFSGTLPSGGGTTAGSWIHPYYQDTSLVLVPSRPPPLNRPAITKAPSTTSKPATCRSGRTRSKR